MIYSKIPNSSVITNTKPGIAIAEVKNKIPDVTNLIKNTDFETIPSAIGNRVTSNKTKQIEVGKKLCD